MCLCLCDTHSLNVVKGNQEELGDLDKCWERLLGI